MNIKKDSINYEKYAGECLEFLKKLIQTRSVCGEDNEASVVNLITLEANKLDLAYLTIEKEPGRPNIFVGEGFGSSSNRPFRYCSGCWSKMDT